MWLLSVSCQRTHDNWSSQLVVGTTRRIEIGKQRLVNVRFTLNSGHVPPDHQCPLSANSGHQQSPVQRGYRSDWSSLAGLLKSAPQRLGMARYSQQPLQLFDLPGGLVVDDNGRAAADRLVKFHHSVGNRSRDTFIFPCTTHQVVVFVVEGREYVVTIFIGFNAAPVVVRCFSHHAQVIKAANRHVMERAFSFDIAGDSSGVNDCPRAGAAIDFCDRVIYIVGVVFRAASLWKLRSCCWRGTKRKYDSHRSERFHGGTLLQGHPFLTTVGWRSRASDMH